VGSGVRTTTLTWPAWLLRSLSVVTRTNRIRRKGGSEGVRAKRWVGPILVLGCSVEEGRERENSDQGEREAQGRLGPGLEGFLLFRNCFENA
jgi:hypothetical protein